MGESEYNGDQTQRVERRRNPNYSLVLPVVVLLVVVAVVSGLVFRGVIQGDQIRVGPEEVPSTQPTVLIAP